MDTTNQTSEITLKEKQSVVYSDPHRFKIVHAGTRFGKTWLISAWLISGVLNNSDWLVWHVLPTYKMGRQIAMPIYNKFLPAWFIKEKNKTDMSWTFMNGSTLAVRGAEDEESLKGVGLNRVAMDEMPRINPEAWNETIRARLTNTLGDAMLSGTPRGKNHFYKMIKKHRNMADWKVFNYKTIEGENVTAKEIENARQSLTERQYREQFLGSFEDVEGALWNQDMIDSLRVESAAVPFERIVIAIDPAVTANADSDETGIIVAAKGSDGHFYVLKDVSGIYTPNEWATRAIEMFYMFGADMIIGEGNNGGDLVDENIHVHNRNLPVKIVHASRGKITRAEPISALYERGRAHHVGKFFELEEQMCFYSPQDKNADSPDRMDALVWAGKELMLPDKQPVYVEYQEVESIGAV